MNNSQYTDSTAEYLYQKGEYINTIFWFVHKQADYEEAWTNHWVAPRTIAFCYDTRAIMQNGNVYGVLDYSKFLEYIKNIAGRLLLWNNTTNKIDVDYDALVNELLHDTTFMEGVFTYLLLNHKASKDTWGIVRVGNGIKVSDGIISVDFGTNPDNPNGPSDLDAWLRDRIRNWADLWAQKDRYGVVKIGDGINVNNGIISVNWNDPNNPGSNTSGSNVTITPILLSGVKIADFTIDGNSGSLYAPQGGTGGGTGGNTTYTDEQINTIVSNINNSISNLSTRIDNFVNGGGFDLQEWSDEELNIIVDKLVTTLNSHGWQSIFATEGWTTDFSAYIRELGLITQGTTWNITGANGRITTVNLSTVIQTLNRYASVIDQIELASDDQGNMRTIRDLESMIAEAVSNDAAWTILKNQILEWDTSAQNVESALSNFVSKVREVDGKFQAYNVLYSGVVQDNINTQSSLRSIADVSKASMSLSSSFGEYDAVTPYLTYENGDVKYEMDEDGHAIPYTGVILEALYADGITWGQYRDSLPTSTYTTVKDINGDDILDNDGKPLVKQRAIKVFYKANSDGDYITYGSAGHGYFREEVVVDEDGEIPWDTANLYHGEVSFISGYGPTVIAYHKKRKLNTVSTAEVAQEVTKSSAFLNMVAEFVSSGASASVKEYLDDNGATLMAEAVANNNLLTLSKYAKASLMANASVYYAKMEYCTNPNDSYPDWRDLELNEGEGDYEYMESHGEYGFRIKRDDSGYILYWQQRGTVTNSLLGEYEPEYGTSHPLLWVNTKSGAVQEGNSSPGLYWEGIKKIQKGAQAGVVSFASVAQAKASLSAELDGVKASVKSSVQYKTKEGQSNKIVDKNDNIIGTINDNGTITMDSGHDLSEAIIVGSVNIDATNVTISAEQVEFATQNVLASGSATFKGNVKATSFEVLKPNSTTDASIKFVTVTLDMLNNLQGIADAGLNVGEPVGIIYDNNNSPKYFFDFAPVNPGSFSADSELTFNITAGANTGTVNISIGDIIYKLTSNGKYVGLPKSNAALLDNANKLYYENINFSFNTVAKTGSSSYKTVNVYLYREFKIISGDKTYTDNYYIVESPGGITGTNIVAYNFSLTTETVLTSNISPQGYWGNTSFDVCVAEASSSKATMTGTSYAAYVHWFGGSQGSNSIVNAPWQAILNNSIQ